MQVLQYSPHSGKIYKAENAGIEESFGKKSIKPTERAQNYSFEKG